MSPPTKARFNTLAAVVRVVRIEECEPDPRGDTVFVVFADKNLGEITWPMARDQVPEIGEVKSICIEDFKPDLRVAS